MMRSEQEHEVDISGTGPQKAAKKKVLRQVMWTFITIATSLTSLGMTAGTTALLHSFFESSFARDGVGVPYEVCIAAIGIAFSLFILYCGFLLVAHWNKQKFARAVQVFIAICVFVSLSSTAWFFSETGQFNIINAICLFFVFLGGALGAAVAERIRLEV